jgi:uncharacterized protein
MPTAPKDSLEIVLVEFLGALSRRDRAALLTVFSADVCWRGIREDWVCHGPSEVVDTLLGAFEHVRPVDALEFVHAGDHVVMGVRSTRLEFIGDEPLGGRIYNVFALQGGKIARVYDYRSRSEALAAAGAADPGWPSAPDQTESATPNRPSTAVAGPIPTLDAGGWTIDTEDPLARAAVAAIRAGDIDAMRRLLEEHPGLATARLGNPPEGRDPGMTRSLLHVVTDWPGHYPNGSAMVRLLVEAGADVNARFTGPHTETPLHWAASSDDVDVLDALLDAGADIEASGAVIAGGTPLSDAVAFGQWQAARRLVERGAHTPFREAAALGLRKQVERHYASSEPPSLDDTTQALWYACRGGQSAVAEYLLECGADLNWVSTWDGLTPLDAAQRSGAEDLVAWLASRGGKTARDVRDEA